MVQCPELCGLGAVRERLGDRRRCDGGVEDMPDVAVLDRHVGGGFAANAARHDHRDLAREVDERLEDAELGAERAPRLGRVGAGLDLDLALAVIAEA